MLVFAHRDAEGSSIDDRLRGFENVSGVVPVVPVRMSEAWLLIDGDAIARAAGSRATVEVPKLNRLEQIPDPKTLLGKLLDEAAGFPTGRRGKKFKGSLAERRVNLASLIEDYSPLENLDAFCKFKSALASVYPHPLPAPG